MWEIPVGASIPLTSSRRFSASCLRLVASLGVISFLAGCSAGSPQPPLAGPPTASPQATVFFCENNDVQCRTANNVFDVGKLRDLFVFVAWRGVSGLHAYQLRFFLPDANHYMTLETRFTTDATPLAPDVQVAVRSRGEPTVVNVLPVAGTFITQHGLTGNWRVEVFLDGEFISQAQFTLQPAQP